MVLRVTYQKIVLLLDQDEVVEVVLCLLYYTVSQKNDTDVAHYNFSAHQPILLIYGRDIAE